MVVTEILRCGSKAVPNDTIIREAIEALRESKRARHESLGTLVSDSSAVQITAEWEDDHEIHPGWSHITDNVKDYIGQPNSIIHISLNEPALGPDGPGTANVVEFAASYFPVSQATPEFKKQIEADFLKFDRTAIKGLKGASGLSYGWVSEEQDHQDISGEKAACFLIMRGWESFSHFEAGTQSPEFKEAAPILFSWGAPFEMVSLHSFSW